MSTKNQVLILAERIARQLVAEQPQARIMLGFDAAILAAHEVFGMGPGRAAAFSRAYHEAMETLAVPLKRPPRGKPATRQDINDAVLVAAMGKSPSGRGDPSTPLRSAQDDSVKARADAFRQEPAALPPVPAPAALSLDEIRQSALELILNHSPGEAVRFQGYVLGMAALVDKLGEKLEAKTT